MDGRSIGYAGAMDAPAPHGRVRLLIVDDSDDFRQLLVTFLEGDDRFELVGEAADAFEAVQLVKSVGPEAVLLDQMMPHVPGLTVLSRTMELAPQTKVVMYTNDPTINGEAMRRGAVAVVSKMESVDLVLDLLHAAVRG